MNVDRWNTFWFGFAALVGGIVTLIRESFSFTAIFFSILGLGGVILGGMPLWKKIFKRKE